MPTYCVHIGYRQISERGSIKPNLATISLIYNSLLKLFSLNTFSPTQKKPSALASEPCIEIIIAL